MRILHHYLCPLLCAISTMALNPIALAQMTFTFTSIDVPGATACTAASGINNNGQIVGTYNQCGQPPQGFLLSGGSYATIDVPGATFTQLNAINDSGEIAGFCEGTPCVGNAAFLRDATGNFSFFNYPSACSSIPLGINNSGQIVGSFTFTCSGSNNGFLLAGGSFSTIAFPGSAPPAGSTEAYGINNNGDIVGRYGIAGPYVENHGYLLSGGTYSPIDIPGAQLTAAFGINDRPAGNIVGTFQDSSGVYHGFVLAGGTFTTLDFPGSTATLALNINNSSQIVGYYFDASGQFHGFLASPVPRFPLGAAANYGVLYTGTGGHNLSATNVTINGNIGVGGTGVVQLSGPGTITGELDFSSGNSGQFHNTNPSNVGPTSVNYSDASVANALSAIDNLSSSLAGLGNNLHISGTQTINEADGELTTVNGTSYRVFSISSYNETDGEVVTINGDGSGDPVVLNFGFASNVNLGGEVALTGGLTPDQVLWNFTSLGKNVSLNNNASSYPSMAFQGIILAPNDVLSMTNANLVGRFFGGGNGDMHIVSGSKLTAPTAKGGGGT